MGAVISIELCAITVTQMPNTNPEGSFPAKIYVLDMDSDLSVRMWWLHLFEAKTAAHKARSN